MQPQVTKLRSALSTNVGMSAADIYGLLCLEGGIVADSFNLIVGALCLSFAGVLV